MKKFKNESQWFENALRVSQVMTRMPFTVSQEVSVDDAKKVMAKHGIRHLPVLNQGELAGLLSERDAQVASVAHGAGCLPVREAMTSSPYTVNSDGSLHEVLTDMINQRIGSAVVVSPRGNVIGIFTVSDALQMLRALVLLGSRELDGAELQYLDREAA